MLRHYLFKRDRRPKDFPHLVHLWPSSSFSFCFSLPSSFTSGGGEISSSSSPPWVCCWLTPMFFLPSKNVGSPLKAMACSRSLIAASWKKMTWFYFWRKELINLNVRPSFRGVGDEVLVKSGLAGKGFVAVAARQLWKDPDQWSVTINRCWYDDLYEQALNFPPVYCQGALLVVCSLGRYFLVLFWDRDGFVPGINHVECHLEFQEGKKLISLVAWYFSLLLLLSTPLKCQYRICFWATSSKSPHVNDVWADELFIKPREEGLVPLIFRRKIYPAYLRFWNVNLCSRSVFQIMRVICCVYVRLLVCALFFLGFGGLSLGCSSDKSQTHPNIYCDVHPLYWDLRRTSPDHGRSPSWGCFGHFSATSHIVINIL